MKFAWISLKMVIIYWKRRATMNASNADTPITDECCRIDAELHKSPVHEQKKFCTSNVPVLLRHPLLSCSDARYPQSRTTRIFPKTFYRKNEKNSNKCNYWKKRLNVRLWFASKWTLEKMITFLRSFSAKNRLIAWKVFQMRFETAVHFSQWIWIKWITTSWIVFTITLVTFNRTRCYNMKSKGKRML